MLISEDTRLRDLALASDCVRLDSSPKDSISIHFQTAAGIKLPLQIGVDSSIEEMAAKLCEKYGIPKGWVRFYARKERSVKVPAEESKEGERVERPPKRGALATEENQVKFKFSFECGPFWLK